MSDVSRRNEAINRMLQVAHKAIQDMVDDPERLLAFYSNKTNGLLILVARGSEAERIEGFARLTKGVRDLGGGGTVETLKPQ